MLWATALSFRDKGQRRPKFRSLNFSLDEAFIVTFSFVFQSTVINESVIWFIGGDLHFYFGSITLALRACFIVKDVKCDSP